MTARASAFATFALVFCLMTCAHAAGIFRVDAASTAAAPDGQSWSNAFSTIQAGIDAATAAGGGEVWVKAGTYTGTTSPVVMMKEGVDLYGGFAGTETERSQRDWTTHVTAIDGETTRRCVNGANGATLDGFTVARGGDSGMTNEGVSPSVTHCVFRENWGWVMDNLGGASPVVSDCRFLKNVGAMRNILGSPSILDCVFSAQKGFYLSESAMENHRNSSVTVADCQFLDNGDSAGGCRGILVDGGSTTVRNCLFSGNNSELSADCRGGAIQITGSASAVVVGSVFHKNAAAYGGAVAAVGGTVRLEGCRFSGNSASLYGGAIFTAPLDIASVNCVFVQNYSGQEGAAIYDEGGLSSRIVNCTLAGNVSSMEGGSVAWGGQEGASLSLVNSILWGGADAALPRMLSVLRTGGVMTVSHCCVQGGYAGEGNTDANPLFISESDHLALQDGSPCIDAGTALGAPATDILGVARPQGAGVDMGAYECAGAAPPRVTSASAVTADNTPTWTWQAGGCFNSSHFRFGFADGLWDGSADKVTGEYTPDTALSDGPHTLYVQGLGNNGEWTASGSFTVTVDTQPPTGSVVINDGAPTANIPAVVLDIAAEDGSGTGAAEMRLSEDGVDWSDWESVQTRRFWTLSEGDGPKWVHLQFRDRAGNISVAPISDSIMLDAAAPTAGILRVDASSAAPAPDGRSWATAYRDIQSAVNAANHMGGEVWVRAGTYTSSAASVLEMHNGIAVYGGFAGTESARDQRNLSSNVCVLDGENLRRCVSGANTAVLDGFILTRGKADSGAGMLNWQASPLVEHCVFAGNHAEIDGGGMYNHGSGPSVVNCVFTNNVAGRNGTALCNTAAVSAVMNCTFVGNHAALSGGAFYAGTGASAPSTITNCIFWDNVDEDGLTADIVSAQGCAPQVTYSCGKYRFSGIGNIAGNPLFVNAPDDLALLPASPCINAGTVSGAPDTDLFGTPRPLGAGIDMGAREFAGVQPPMVASAPAITTDNTPTWTWTTAGTGGTGHFRAGFWEGGWTLVRDEAVTSFTPGTPLSDGRFTLYVQELGTDGTWSLSGKCSVLVDTKPPYVAVYPPSAIAVSGGTATYPVVYDDFGSGVSAVTLSVADIALERDGTANASVSLNEDGPLARTVVLSNITGEGKLGISINAGTAVDMVGNISGTGRSTTWVVVDRTPPTGTIVINGGAAATATREATLSLSWNEPFGRGVVRMRFSDDGATWSGWELLKAARTYTLPDGDGHKTVRVQYRDMAGNISATASDYIRLDTTGPTGTVEIDGGSPFTSATQTTLLVSCSDGAGTGVARMRLSSDGVSWGAWGAIKTSLPWTLASGDGEKRVYAQFQDVVGNISPVPAQDAILLDQFSPSVDIALATPSPSAADTVAFTVAFSEPVEGLEASDVQVSGSLTGTASVAGMDANYSVTVVLDNPDMDGAVGIGLAGGAASDARGNASDAALSGMCFIHNWPGFNTAQPGNVWWYTGDTVTLDAEIDSQGVPTSYQWWRDNGTKGMQPGPTTAQWTLGAVTPADDGMYWCNISYDGLEHAGNRIRAQVAAPLTIKTPPVGAEVEPGSTHRFTVLAEGGFAQLSYQWRKDGTNIPLAEDAELVLTRVSQEDAGWYDVTVSDSRGSTVDAGPVRLSVSGALPAMGVFGLALLAIALGLLAVKRR